jgi:hypothetical protein
MSTDKKNGAPTSEFNEGVLEISLRAVPSKHTAFGGKQIPFTKGILSIRNAGSKPVVGLSPQATLAQEGGSVQDATKALAKDLAAGSIAPGETLEWNLYDVLLIAHPGIASKVHLFGYKAVLNWWFELAVWAEYRLEDEAPSLKTPVFRWKLRWSPASPPANAIEFSFE